MEIKARAHRDGSFWAVEIPINGGIEYTQGRTLSEAQTMAEDLVSIWAEELHDKALAQAKVVLAIDDSIKKAADTVRDAQAKADEARTQARAAQAEAVAQLRADGLTQQDIAHILGVTKGRISQLLNA